MLENGGGRDFHVARIGWRRVDKRGILFSRDSWEFDAVAFDAVAFDAASSLRAMQPLVMIDGDHFLLKAVWRGCTTRETIAISDTP